MIGRNCFVLYGNVLNDLSVFTSSQCRDHLPQSDHHVAGFSGLL